MHCVGLGFWVSGSRAFSGSESLGSRVSLHYGPRSEVVRTFGGLGDSRVWDLGMFRGFGFRVEGVVCRV